MICGRTSQYRFVLRKTCGECDAPPGKPCVGFGPNADREQMVHLTRWSQGWQGWRNAPHRGSSDRMTSRVASYVTGRKEKRI